MRRLLVMLLALNLLAVVRINDPSSISSGIVYAADSVMVPTGLLDSILALIDDQDYLIRARTIERDSALAILENRKEFGWNLPTNWWAYAIAVAVGFGVGVFVH